MNVRSWTDYMQISRAIGRQDFAAAAASCQALLLQNPDDGFALALLAHSYAALGQTGEALDTVDKVLASRPHDFLMLQLAANLCAQRDDHARAKEFVVRALAADPHSYDVPEWVLLLLRSFLRVPILRRSVRAEALEDLSPEKKERDSKSGNGGQKNISRGSTTLGGNRDRPTARHPHRMVRGRHLRILHRGVAGGLSLFLDKLSNGRYRAVVLHRSDVRHRNLLRVGATSRRPYCHGFEKKAR
jgi:tetratricopeptide (TPR) repeat protein